jgi:hypothetical protein
MKGFFGGDLSRWTVTRITLNQIMRLTASLGGFPGRTSDGERGAKNLLSGMQ